MMTETQQPLNLQADVLPEKAAPQMNSQGEVIQNPPAQQELQQQAGSFDDVIELGDTALAPAADALKPATDDTGMVHEVISCGHVLKSTHDLARWSEKTGARRVNSQESIDAVSDLAVNLEPNRTGGRRKTNNNNSNNNNSNNNNSNNNNSNNNSNNNNSNNNSNNDQGGDPAADIQGLFDENRGRGGRRNNRQQQSQQKWQPVEGGSAEKSEVINCWSVLKSTHDQAQLSEKRGRNAVNKAETSGALDELALNQNQQQNQGGQQQQNQGGQQQQKGGQQQQGGNSQILNSWPVLKSTHDQAMFSEKRGANAVNKAEAGQCLDEVAQNTQGTQAGGSSLQSGMDTQAGSHIQMDNNQ